MHNMMWQDNDGQWWFFEGVESTLVDSRPKGLWGKPTKFPVIECNTGQVVPGRKVEAKWDPE